MHEKTSQCCQRIQRLLRSGCCAIKITNFLPSLLLRLYLVPIFWVVANNKWNPFDSASSLMHTADWFRDSLHLPFPLLMAILAWSAEYFGAILLALGLGVRLVAIPLMITMAVAATTVHWEHGWQTIHDTNSPFASEHVGEAKERLGRAEDILREHGHYGWLTKYGKFVKLNNGIELSVTYFVMLLSLFYLGGGRYISLDYWIRRRLCPGSSCHSREKSKKSLENGTHDSRAPDSKESGRE